MGKAINGLLNFKDEEAKSENYKLTYKEFEPHVVTLKQKTSNPHERTVTKIREVKYLRDGFVKEDNITKKIVLESYGTEIVEERLVPVSDEKYAYPDVVGQVVRDLRRKEEN